MASKVDSSGLSVISEDSTSARKHQENNDDYDSACRNHKSKSNYGNAHKKKPHPLMLGPSRQTPGKIISLHAAAKGNLSEFTQRIMSAKLIRTKQVQNQLNETQNQLNELINENKVLRNLLKRQEGALKKYEGNHAELPQLIRSHNEEIRALKANNKLIKSQLRESNTKLKEREAELEALRDNYNKLKKLSTEKNLLEREKLQKKVDELQEIIKEQEEKIQVLSRKVLLESKNYKHHLNIEVIKHKETQKDLSSALSMISKLERELMSKDKQLPGSKVILKREMKNLSPIIVNKSHVQPKLGVSEDSFLNRIDENQRVLNDESPDPELELLNCLESSEDTPSPTQDIFPDINEPKKSNHELKTKTEITYSKSEIFQINNRLSAKSPNDFKCKKNLMSKKKLMISKDPELNARAIVESLSEEMETIDILAERVQANTLGLENKEVDSIFQELNSQTPKLSSDIEKVSVKNIQKEQSTNQRSKRTVPKRKLEDFGESKDEAPEKDHTLELTQSQQEKLENMTKTWNNLKSKIQEERKKAEEKMKELQEIGGDQNSDNDSFEKESDKDENTELKPQITKELNFANITDDSYILEELNKTDKVFNKLRGNLNKKSNQSSSSSNKKPKAQTPKPTPDIKSFRTESHREPKYLEEFQKEYQKQNLLKALKAIDVGKDPNVGTDDSDSSDSEKKKQHFQQKNGLKHIRHLNSDSDKGLMAELFGSRQKLNKSENLKLSNSTVASVNE